MPQITIQQAMELALQHHQAGRLREAEAVYRQVLAQQPNHADATHLLGVVAWDLGQLPIAQQLIARAIQLDPNSGVYYSNLGMLLLAQDQLDRSIACFQKAIQLSPDLYDAHFNLGLAMARSGQYSAAANAYSKALQFDPANPSAWNNLGNVQDLLGDLPKAIESFRRAASLKPDAAEFLSNLADALARHGHLDESIETSRKALQIQPDLSEAANHLGNALRETGQMDQAIDAYRQALRAHPEHAVIHSNLIYAMHFSPTYGAADIAHELTRWREQHTRDLAPMTHRETVSRRLDRPLRIGYLSPDFRDHCQSFFTLPLLAHHDRQQFEIYCYADVPRPDSVTGKLKSHTHGWRNIAGKTDQAVAELIHADRIDILVDLTLHMSRNRMLVFARKPAPIQVTWLGYPSSTGLTTVDYRITDVHLDPIGVNDSYYTEKSVYLPDSFWCFEPLVDEPERISTRGQAAPITFGCLNSFAKVNPQVLALWAKVLLAVPDSRMLILTDMGSHRQRTLDAFKNLGVEPSRINFVGRQSRPIYLELFNRIDISLDTFPANGHTTTMDSLWMGVPVVTLPGATAISRGAMSILKTIGLPRLAAETEDEYVRIASSLAKNRTELLLVQSTLRRRMQASPLMDAARFARSMEELYRSMWLG